MKDNIAKQIEIIDEITGRELDIDISEWGGSQEQHNYGQSIKQSINNYDRCAWHRDATSCFHCPGCCSHCV